MIKKTRIRKQSISLGFTLIEIIVTITIIGLLTTIGIVSFQQAVKKGRDGKRKSDLAQIQSALEIYRSDVAAYPTGLAAGGAAWTYDGNTYMQKVPLDPKPTPYQYYYSSDGISYDICAYLESPSSTDGSCGAGTVSCGDENCNYGVSNP